MQFCSENPGSQKNPFSGRVFKTHTQISTLCHAGSLAWHTLMEGHGSTPLPHQPMTPGKCRAQACCYGPVQGPRCSWCPTRYMWQRWALLATSTLIVIQRQTDKTLTFRSLLRYLSLMFILKTSQWWSTTGCPCVPLPCTAVWLPDGWSLQKPLTFFPVLEFCP